MEKVEAKQIVLLIDNLICRRMAELTANNRNAKERKEASERAMDALQQVLEDTCKS